MQTYADKVRALARTLHADIDIQIDPDADLSEGDDGTWVAAWVFVPKGSLLEDEEDEA